MNCIKAKKEKYSKVIICSFFSLKKKKKERSFYCQRCQRSQNLLVKAQVGFDAPWVTAFLVLFTSCLSKVTAASVSTAGRSGVALKLYLQTRQRDVCLFLCP